MFMNVLSYCPVSVPRICRRPRRCMPFNPTMAVMQTLSLGVGVPPDGMQVPEELARREKRLTEVARKRRLIGSTPI